MNDITPKILEELRENKGWSKTEVARRLGIKTVSTYANWEYGIRTPDKDMLAKIAELYGKTTDYLITGKESESISVAGQEITLTPEELKVFEELKKNPTFFHDLASDPEKRIKELIKLQKAKKLFLEEDDGDYGNCFGDLDDDL